jgi:acyl transferase domain-containing protein
MAKEEDVRRLLTENVSIAAVNAPSLCVASGPDDAIAVLEKALVSAKKMFRRLQTSHAFHSAMMDAVVGPFSDVLSGVSLSPPRIPFVSNLTATWVGDGEATSPLYWAQHLRQAVRFSDGIAGLLRAIDGVVFLEAGPGSALTKLTREHRSGASLPVAVSSLSPGDHESDLAAMLGALGRLWQEGVEVDWAGFYKGEIRRSLDLPGTLSSERL